MEKRRVKGGKMINIHITAAVISLGLGILVLVWPKVLNYAVAAWLIINGLVGIFA
jgi:hypothetical protein